MSAAGKSPLSVRDMQLVAACSLAMAMIGYATIVMGVIAPLFVRQTGISVIALGPIFSAIAIGGASGAMAAPFAERRFGKKRVLIVSLLLMAAGLILSAWATAIGPMLTLRAVTGFGTGLATPLAMAVAGTLIPPDHTARASSIIAAGAPAGTFLTGIVGAFGLDWFGWPPMFVGGGVLCLAVAAAIVFSHPADAARPEGQPQPASGRIGSRAAVLFGAARQLTMLIVIVALMSSIAMYVIGSWLPIVLNSNGLSVQDGNVALALFTIGGSLGAVLVGQMLPPARPRVGVALAYLVGAIGVAALSLEVARGLILLAALCAGIFAYGAHMSMFLLMNILYPRELRVLALGGLVVIFRIGGFLGPLIASLLLWMGLELGQVMVATSVLLLATGAVLLMPLRQDRDSAANR